jgi:nitroreductase
MTTMEIQDAIFQRRAVRRYAGREIEPAMVNELLRAAAQAPSALNQQPWAFAVFHGASRLREFSERAKSYLLSTYPSTFEPHPRAELYATPGYDIFHGARTLIIIYATPGRFQPIEECYLAAQNLMLAAHARGLATCPIGFARPWLDLPEVKETLGIPPHYVAAFPLVVGYPDGTADPVPKKDPEIIAWKWDRDPAPPQG